MPGTEGGGVRGCRVFILLLVDIIDDTGTNLAVFSRSVPAPTYLLCDFDAVEDKSQHTHALLLRVSSTTPFSGSTIV